MIDWREHLTSDPKVCGGQLSPKGTRVLVTVILDNLAEGLGLEKILRSYPTLEPIHIDAVWRTRLNSPGTLAGAQSGTIALSSPRRGTEDLLTLSLLCGSAARPRGV